MTARHRFDNPEFVRPLLNASDLQKILSLQGTILQKAVVSDQHRELLDELCILAESFTPNSVATIMLLDTESGTLNVANGPSLTPEAILAFNGLRPGQGSCGNAVFHGEAMYVCNTHEDSRWEDLRDIATKFGIRSCFSFPIRDANNRLIGSFAISCFETRKAEGFQRALLETCTAIASVILQRQADSEARERRLAEDIQSEKLASLGVLAGGIAHDFNNLLSTILGNIDLALLEVNDEVQPQLEWAARACERAGELTKQLLTFSRGGTPIKKPNDIGAIIREAAEFALHGSNVNYELDGLEPSSLGILNIDGGQINQLLQNLVINARQSMVAGGTVKICCSETDQTANEVLQTGDYLRIDVSDTGGGIPPKLLEKIFDPYFTTRAEGTGLGLSLCYSISQNHGGHISVRSDHEGSCFSVFLPLQTGLELEQSVAASKPSKKLGKRAIVMDDDAMVRDAVARMMKQIGFEVLTAQDGQELLQLYDQEVSLDRSIDLMIVDLTIPGGMGGLEAKDALRERDPNAKIVVSSGYSADHVLSDYRTHGFSGAVAKPYRTADLAKVVSDVLG